MKRKKTNMWLGKCKIDQDFRAYFEELESILTIFAPKPNLPRVCRTPCLLPERTLPNMSPMLPEEMP